MSKTNNTNYFRNLPHEEVEEEPEEEEPEDTALLDYVKTIKKGGRLA
tara:strand:- start:472 stop:612 length:141 start_codon:yes stop_codon:yes gene_type:complete